MDKKSIFFTYLLIVGMLALPGESVSQSVTLMEATGIEVVKTVDEMTDEESCSVRLDDQGIYTVVSSSDRIAFFRRGTSGRSFSPQDQNLIRVADKSPYELQVGDPSDILILQGEHATRVIKALASNEDVTFRYYMWPSREQRTMDISYPGLGFGYDIASRECAWEDIGLSSEPAPPKLHSRESDSRRSYSFRGVSNLGLSIVNMETEPRCDFEFRSRPIISYSEGTFSEGYGAMPISGGAVRVYDREKNIKYEINIEGYEPLEEDKIISLVRSIADNLPLGWFGYQRSETRGTDKISLLGFKELYKKGEDICNMPSLEDISAK